MSKPDKPSELEMQILGVLWQSAPATAREVLGRMPDGKQRAYTTVLSTMQGMEKKGLLTREREGLTDQWRPAVSKSGVLGPFLRTLVRNVFGGRPEQVLQHLLQETEVGTEELAEIRRLIDAHESQRSTKPRAAGKAGAKTQKGRTP